eukprot:Lankesteria_metandrocarpae@DN10028_c0_g1_i1.p1
MAKNKTPSPKSKRKSVTACGGVQSDVANVEVLSVVEKVCGASDVQLSKKKGIKKGNSKKQYSGDTSNDRVEASSNSTAVTSTASRAKLRSQTEKNVKSSSSISSSSSSSSSKVITKYDSINSGSTIDHIINDDNNSTD